jgi:amino acid adenylation domain-containing protein
LSIQHPRSGPGLRGSAASLADIVATRAAETPDAIAVEDGDELLTYADLEAWSAAVASGLVARGIDPGDLVAVCLPRSWRFVCAVVGVVRAGAAYVPLSADSPPARLRTLIDLADPAAVIGSEPTLAALPPERESIDCAGLLQRQGEAPELDSEDRLAYVLFTSGSTGVPKGVEIGEAEVLHLLGCGSDLLAAPGDGVLMLAPTEFDISVLEMWGGLAAGARLVLVPPGRPDPAAVGRLVGERGVTYIFFAAGFFAEVVRVALPELGGLRLIASGGDVISPAAVAAVREAHPGVRVVNAYGPTETTIICSQHEVREAEEGPIPIGRELSGYEFHVLDEEGRPVSDGESGELWVGGGGVARGYRGDPERTADRFRPDPFDDDPAARIYGTGDIVRRRPDGAYEILGRVDDQVKIAGYRVEPGEVSQALGRHPAVHHAAVVAREDVSGHKRLVGFVSPRDGARADAEELRSYLLDRLPAYMVPAVIELLPELPLTERGKVDRAALPAPARTDRAVEEPTAEGPTSVVAGLMADLLGLERVGADENYFHLGADSLLAIQLLGRLRQSFDAELVINSVFEAPTPRGLATLIERGGAPARPPLVARERAGPAPASFAQRRAWLFERLNPGSHAYQFAAVLEFEGDLDPAALAGAIDDLLRRHEILRTALVEVDGEPAQVVRDRVPTPLEVVDMRGDDQLAWLRFLRSRVSRKIRLDQAPMIQFTLVRRGERRWSLIDREHHAVHDGWSFVVMLSELAELYSARVDSREPALAPLTVQFGDFSEWEREVLDPGRRRDQLDYWRRKLDPDPPLLDLTPGRPRPARESFAGGSIRRRMDPDLAAGLRRLAQETGTTFFQLCLAAFAVMLGRLGGVEEVQTGVALANRRDPTSEQLIGMTVETVAVRVDLSGSLTVRDLLAGVRGDLLGAIANADVPFDAVVEEIAPPRRPGRSPLIQTLFSFDDAPMGSIGWSGLRHRVIQTLTNRTAKADLNVIGVDHGDHDPFFIWEHSELLTDVEASRLADRHLRLLERFRAEPDVPIAALDLVNDDEREQLSRWAAGDAEYERLASIPDLVRRAAEIDPEAVAVRGPDGEVGYGELLDRGRRIAGALRDRGVGRGDRVGILLPRSPEGVAAHLGVLLAGAAYVPLDLGHPIARSAGALATTGATVAIAAGEAEGLPDAVRVLDVAEALRGEPWEADGIGPDDLAYVIFTSGSTGRPKGVEVTHRNVVRLLDDPAFVELGPGTTMLHAASTAFDAATLEIWGPLLNGGTVATLADPPTPDAIATAVEYGVDTLWLTAGLFHELVDRRPDCLAGVHQLLAGGDVLSPDHVRRALAALPTTARLVNGYGPTETTVFALTQTLRPGVEISGPVPLGRPVQGAVCEVLDVAGRPTPVGAAGELWIGGDGVARGYGGEPELTAERFRTDPETGARRYRSGDRVYRDDEGTIHFLGRADRQVKVRGVRVEPGEVEAALREHPGVGDAAVVIDPGGRLIAYLVPVAGGPDPDPSSLRADLAARLPAAMVPVAWVPIERLPLTANGKLDRDRLPAPSDDHLAVRRGEGVAKNEAEGAVIAAFEKVLGLRGVGPEDDFFALGGHSLLAVELFADLERLASRRLSLAMIFEASTPRELARRVGSDAPASDWDNLVALKPGGGRPPLFVVSAGDGNLVGFAPLARHLSAEQPLYGLQPSGLDGRQPLDRGIEAMAERYLARVREVQPHGPYLLAGRCNGASVAYEMAQRLRAAGESVPALVALDSDPPPAGPPEVGPGVPFDPMIESAVLRGEEDGLRPPSVDDGPALRAWLREPVGRGVSRYLLEAWRWRDDLRDSWPDPCGADAAALAWWAWENGLDEMGLAADLLLPAATDRCRLPDGSSWHRALDAAWEEIGPPDENPLSAAGWSRFRDLLLEPVAGVDDTNRYLQAAATRWDLAPLFADPAGADRQRLLDWAWSHGVKEELDPSLLPPPTAPLDLSRRLELRSIPVRRTASRVGRRARSRAIAVSAELKARGVEATERRLDRPLPGARWRIERRVLAAARRARASYRAEPWPGEVLLVTSSEFADKPTYRAWAARAQGGVDRRELAVGHVEMLREPGVAQLSECLELYIGEALAR